MSDLTRFREHCAQMATAQHKPECPSLSANIPYWPPMRPDYDDEGYVYRMVWNGPPPPAPKCDGCLSDDHRALFARLAAEVDDYLDPPPELF